MSALEREAPSMRGLAVAQPDEFRRLTDAEVCDVARLAVRALAIRFRRAASDPAAARRYWLAVSAFDDLGKLAEDLANAAPRAAVGA